MEKELFDMSELSGHKCPGTSARRPWINAVFVEDRETEHKTEIKTEGARKPYFVKLFCKIKDMNLT